MSVSVLGTTGAPIEASAMSMAELLELPPTVSVATAARALGIGKDKAYLLIKSGAFPAAVIPLGSTCRVATASLWRVLHVQPG
ncbi:DNA-binding protein (plasmid) [Streptomyces sp. BI20]|uniref:DNA-binding protein n=1 Tax=Streptomyces sp. BI20 TaxID=3403460 RepID=UPI003C73B267